MDYTHQVHFGVQIPRDGALQERILQFDFLFETINNVELQQLKKSIGFAALTSAEKDPTNPVKLSIFFKGNRPYLVTAQSKEDRNRMVEFCNKIVENTRKGVTDYSYIADDVRTSLNVAFLSQMCLVCPCSLSERYSAGFEANLCA